MPAQDGHATAAGGNRNPQLSWSGAPDGTRSYAVLAIDLDAPADPSDVNVEGKTIAFDAPHAKFAHWILVDIPADVAEIPEGADSNSITPSGKPTGAAELGVRGANDYTSPRRPAARRAVLPGRHPDLAAPTAATTGLSRPGTSASTGYRFVVYALDVPSLADDFSLAYARKAIDGHILAQAE